MLISINDYLARPKLKSKWLVNQMVPLGGFTTIYGKPKSGKTQVALGLSIAVAQGWDDWQGIPIEMHGPVVWVQFDTPDSEWHDRWWKQKKLGYYKEGGGEMFTVDWKTTPYPFDLLDPTHFELIKGKLAVIKPALVIWDTLREVHSLEEDKADTMRNVISRVRATDLTTSHILLAHSKKESKVIGTAEDLMYDLRGSSYISGKMDMIVRVSSNDDGRGHIVYKGRGSKPGSYKFYLDDEGIARLDEEDIALRLLAEQLAAQEFATNSARADELIRRYELATEKKISKATAIRRLAEAEGKQNNDAEE